MFNKFLSIVCLGMLFGLNGCQSVFDYMRSDNVDQEQTGVK